VGRLVIWPHLLAFVAIGAALLVLLLLKPQRSATREVRLRSGASSKPRSGWVWETFRRGSSPRLPARFERMDGAEFEAEVSELLRERGYSVRPTPAWIVHDVDLLLETTGRKVAVRLKRGNAPVGDRLVYRLFTARIHYATDEAWLITTSRFTPKAVKLAKTTGVRLVDGTELAEWLEVGREVGPSALSRGV
jgi:hypothetical protein